MIRWDNSIKNSVTQLWKKKTMCALSENPFVYILFLMGGFVELLFLRHSNPMNWIAKTTTTYLLLLFLLLLYSRNSTRDVSIECCLGYIFRSLFAFICSFYMWRTHHQQCYEKFIFLVLHSAIKLFYFG